MTSIIKIKGEQNLRHNLNIWKKDDAFDILNGISENVTLLQLMDSLGNVNHAINIVGNWIFDSNNKKALCLTQELLDIICSPSIGKEQVATFQSVFFSVRYIWAIIHLKKDKHDTIK